MADNVALSSSTSDTIAADDIGGVKYQRVKPTFGADGTATDVSSSNPLPVVQTGTPELPTGAATEAKQPALGTAGTASSDVLSVQGVSGMTAVKVEGAGTAGTNSGGLLTVQGHAAGVPMPVSGTVTTQLSTGTNTVGNVGLIPRTSGGCSTSLTISAASNNATSVKTSAGQVFGIIASNVNAAVRYLKLYNKASAPTVGTDTPVMVIPLPGTTTGGGAILNFPVGIAFGTGIAFALTTGVANSDTGTVSANEHAVTILYA